MKTTLFNMFLGLFIASQLWVGVACYVLQSSSEETHWVELMNSEDKDSEEKESEKESENEETLEEDQKITEDFLRRMFGMSLFLTPSIDDVDFHLSPYLEISLPPPERKC